MQIAPQTFHLHLNIKRTTRLNPWEVLDECSLDAALHLRGEGAMIMPEDQNSWPCGTEGAVFGRRWPFYTKASGDPRDEVFQISATDVAPDWTTELATCILPTSGYFVLISGEGICLRGIGRLGDARDILWHLESQE